MQTSPPHLGEGAARSAEVGLGVGLGVGHSYHFRYPYFFLYHSCRALMMFCHTT